MKKFLTAILVIISCITIFIIIGVLEIGNLNDKKITEKLIDNMKTSEIVKNTSDDNYLNIVYRRLNIYGVEKNKVNEVINSDIFNQYAKNISLKYMDYLLNNTEVNYKDINNTTLNFIEEINTKYKLNLSEDDCDDISYIISNNTNKVSLKIKNNNNFKYIREIIKTCNYDYIRISLFLLLILEILFIYLLTKSRKTFINNICIILILTSILLSSVTFIIKLIITKKVSYLLDIINPIVNRHYMISIVFIVIFIIMLIIKNIISKKKVIE